MKKFVIRVISLLLAGTLCADPTTLSAAQILRTFPKKAQIYQNLQSVFRQEALQTELVDAFEMNIPIAASLRRDQGREALPERRAGDQAAVPSLGVEQTNGIDDVEPLAPEQAPEWLEAIRNWVGSENPDLTVPAPILIKANDIENTRLVLDEFRIWLGKFQQAILVPSYDPEKGYTFEVLGDSSMKDSRRLYLFALTDGQKLKPLPPKYQNKTQGTLGQLLDGMGPVNLLGIETKFSTYSGGAKNNIRQLEIAEMPSSGKRPRVSLPVTVQPNSVSLEIDGPSFTTARKRIWVSDAETGQPLVEAIVDTSDPQKPKVEVHAAVARGSGTRGSTEARLQAVLDRKVRGDQLRRWREKLELSQERLGRILYPNWPQDVPIQPRISSIEHGIVNITNGHLRQIRDLVESHFPGATSADLKISDSDTDFRSGVALHQANLVIRANSGRKLKDQTLLQARAKTLEKLRKDLGITMLNLAHRLGLAGKPADLTQKMFNWEHGDTFISDETMAKIENISDRTTMSERAKALTKLRDHLNITAVVMAGLLGFSGTYAALGTRVRLWEKGKVRIPDAVWERIEELRRLPNSGNGTQGSSDREDNEEGTARQSLRNSLAHVPAGTKVPSLTPEFLDALLAMGPHITPEQVIDIAKRTTRLRDLDLASAGGIVLAVRDVLQNLDPGIKDRIVDVAPVQSSEIGLGQPSGRIKDLKRRIRSLLPWTKSSSPDLPNPGRRKLLGDIAASPVKAAVAHSLEAGGVKLPQPGIRITDAMIDLLGTTRGLLNAAAAALRAGGVESGSLSQIARTLIEASREGALPGELGGKLELAINRFIESIAPSGLPPSIAIRPEVGEARLAVTSPKLYLVRQQMNPIRSLLPQLPRDIADDFAQQFDALENEIFRTSPASETSAQLTIRARKSMEQRLIIEAPDRAERALQAIGAEPMENSPAAIRHFMEVGQRPSADAIMQALEQGDPSLLKDFAQFIEDQKTHSLAQRWDGAFRPQAVQNIGTAEGLYSRQGLDLYEDMDQFQMRPGAWDYDRWIRDPVFYYRDLLTGIYRHITAGAHGYAPGRDYSAISPFIRAPTVSEFATAIDALNLNPKIINEALEAAQKILHAHDDGRSGDRERERRAYTGAASMVLRVLGIPEKHFGGAATTIRGGTGNLSPEQERLAGAIANGVPVGTKLPALSAEFLESLLKEPGPLSAEGIRAFADLDRKSAEAITAVVNRFKSFNEVAAPEAKEVKISISMEEVSRRVSLVLQNAPTTLQPPLTELFKTHLQYFQNVAELDRFEKRFKKFGPRIYKELTPSLFSAKDRGFQTIIFLMIVRGTIKDLVWHSSLGIRQTLEGHGVDVSLLGNLFSPDQARSALARVLAKELFSNVSALSDELEYQTGRPLRDFTEGRDGLGDIFSDQVIDAIRISLKQRALKLPEQDHRVTEIRQILTELIADSVGETTFSLNGRNMDGLKGGDRAGDCTAPGSFNFWTLGTWNAAFENSELEVFYQGKFFARFVFIVVSSGRPVLWIHAVEFTPLARQKGESRFADPKLQKLILSQSLRFIAGYAAKARLSNIYLTQISNSFGFVDILPSIVQGIAPEGVLSATNQDFTLMKGVDSAHELLLHAGNRQDTVGIYLQGWGTGTMFPKSETITNSQIDARIARIGGIDLPRDEVDRFSRLLLELIRQDLNQTKRSLEAIQPKQYERSFAQAYMQNKLDEFTGNLAEKLASLTQTFDPGELGHVHDILNEIFAKIQSNFARLKPPTVDELSVTNLIGIYMEFIVGRSKTKGYWDLPTGGVHNWNFEKWARSRYATRNPYLKSVVLNSMPRWAGKHYADSPEELQTFHDEWAKESIRRLSKGRLKKQDKQALQPPEELQQIVSKLMANIASFEKLDVNGQQMMGVIGNINPNYMRLYRDHLRGDRTEAQLLESFPNLDFMLDRAADIVDYYKMVVAPPAHPQTPQEILLAAIFGRPSAPSLTSSICAYELRRLMPATNDDAGSLNSGPAESDGPVLNSNGGYQMEQFLARHPLVESVASFIFGLGLMWEAMDALGLHSMPWMALSTLGIGFLIFKPLFYNLPHFLATFRRTFFYRTPFATGLPRESMHRILVERAV